MALAGAFISIGAASCTDEYEYAPAAASKGNAYINAEGSTVLGFLPTADQTFNVKVVRSDSAQAGTVHLTSSNTKFQVPAEVTFNAGEKTKTVSVIRSMRERMFRHCWEPSSILRSIKPVNILILFPLLKMVGIMTSRLQLTKIIRWLLADSEHSTIPDTERFT